MLPSHCGHIEGDGGGKWTVDLKGEGGVTPGDRGDAECTIDCAAEDWAKIQSSLKSDVGAGGGEGVPEGYRGLVKEYFEQISRGK